MGKNRVWDNFNYTKGAMMPKMKRGDGRWAIGYGFTIAHCLLPIACFILWGCAGHQIIITKDPLKAEEHIKLAQIYEAKGETGLAVQEYKKALEQDKTNPIAYFGLGNISYKKGKFADAEVYYKKAIENTPADDPRNAMFYNNLSWVYIETNKDLQEAERLVQKAIVLDAARAQIYQDTLGVMYTKLKEYEQAEKAFLSALQNAQGDTTALRYIYQHLAELYRLTGGKDALKLQQVIQKLNEISK